MSGRSPRHETIIQLVKDNGFMSIEELASILDVTPQTIRRDINHLCEENVLRRYHGGAALGGSVGDEDYFARKAKLQSEKTHIAQLVADNIPNNSSLFMSIGTTLEAVASTLIQNHSGLRVITNNIHVASIVSSRADFSVMITSGTVRASDGGITGMATLDFINQFKVDYAILGVSGIEADGALLDFDYREVRIARAMMENARHRFLAADHTKFGRNALVRMGNITDFDAIFTDGIIPENLRKQMEEEGVRYHLANR
ncbi:DeoR/GlpR family DNA-binding transcription regulator [Neisseria sp. Ec49-e6-T10]|uniref:DeoR/GlpR family DNA-binding transcription regulator n=1 Tax=Neisseria sp. Ec49-e6-T10 TaxID=3140744 RepID=UPI003EB6BB4A